ncbi:putative T7SS-secreted protein [Actinosynnema sp.]|uniref:putative T7SS-secreted protein n=1 Tax=Actinosynnema sp. TaxID=1872144 RepID=UPI003F87A901
MSALGQTSDPRDLVPGLPEAIGADLRLLVQGVRAVSGAGADLGSVDVAGWTGEAAEAFRGAFGEEPPLWLAAVEELGEGGEALADYAAKLVWAQAEAQRAIELHAAAKALSRLARSHFLAQVASGLVGTFADPAAGVFQEAERILRAARDELAEAGGRAAEELGLPEGPDGRHGKSGGTRFGDGMDPAWKKKPAEFGHGASPGLDEDFAEGATALLDLLGVDVPTGEWSGEAEARVWGVDGEGSFDDGLLSGDGRYGVDVLGAGARADAKWGASGITATASAEAYLAKLEASGQVRMGEHASASGSATGYVGATGSGRFTLNASGARAEVDAFAGARAKAEGSVEAAGIGVGGTAEAWAGAGLTADAQLGLGPDGKFHVGGSFGAGLGLGGKLGFEFTVDPRAVVSTAADAAGAIGDGLSAVGGAVDNAGKQVTRFFGDLF